MKLREINPPPFWVIRAARAELGRKNSWQSYYAVLSAYYGIHAVTTRIEDEVPKRLPVNTMAYYTYGLRRVTCIGPNMSEYTAAHEFFHHLESEYRFKIPRNAAEALANSFADSICEASP